jgi:tripartite-type tricarboxylate transporter receptor subunit TctC
MRMIPFALALTVAGGAAQADAVSDFYKDKTVSIVIGGSPGGGYDLLARTTARYLGHHIPGNPTIIVRNMAGAGGITATKFIYQNAPKDGTAISIANSNTPFEPMYGTKEADYDATKFVFLGSPGPETSILTVWHETPVSTVEEARKNELKMGSSGANSTPSFYGRMLIETLGLKIKLIVGYPGQNDALLAMEKGEIDGYPSAFYNSLMSTRPTWIADKRVKLIVQYGAAPEKALPNVPFAPDLVTTQEDKLLWRAAVAPLALGRPFLAPPETPADRAAALRKALAETFADKDFLNEADKLQLGVATPMSGDEVKAIIEQAYQLPPSVIARLRKIAAP